MLRHLARLFGYSPHHTLDALQPYLQAIHAHEEKLQVLDDTQLRHATTTLKQALHTTLEPYATQVSTLEARAKTHTRFQEKHASFQQAQQAAQHYDTQLEKELDKILPQAFAILRESARRLAKNGVLVVDATDYDRTLAAHHPYITIQGEKAHWHNRWEAGGQTITWDMIPYDVQLLGGIVLHQGKIAEMATGEGKTLAAALPAFLNALAGKGVHIITVNDYLAERDAAWMGPLYQFHGLTVACADSHPPLSPARRQAYQADITYLTTSELGFDYLRDNMATIEEEKVQRPKLHYCIVDEADSALLDSARTPLIISGAATHDDTHHYQHLKPRVQLLYQKQQVLVAQQLRQAKKEISLGEQGDKEHLEKGSKALFRAYRGLPKYPALIQYLSQKGIKKRLSDTEDYYLQENKRLMPEADAPLYFTLDAQNHDIELTDLGIETLTTQGEDPHFFLLPDIAVETGKIAEEHTLTEEEKAAKQQILQAQFNEKSARLHAVQQLLKAYTLFEKDSDYVVLNHQVKIVDSKTGRLLRSQRYSKGLHQAIEAKEHVPIQRPTQTHASITIQNLIRMYHKPAGMTGTAETEAAELCEIYKLDVVVIPPNKPLVREDKDDKIYKTKEEKHAAIKTEVKEYLKQGRPVLVGTATVEESEVMRKLLQVSPSQLLNAKNHLIESQIIAQAGQPGKVTIVTQMGGRGTDIKLTPQAKAAGGLAIIGTERHESRRVDRQLRGRAGRQGDPGSSQFFISLEDKLMAHFRHGLIGSQMDKVFMEPGEVIQDPYITRAIGSAQQRVEQNHFAARKQALSYDDVMDVQRKVIYQRRNNALQGEWIALDLLRMMHEHATLLATNAKQTGDFTHLRYALQAATGKAANLTQDDLYYQTAKALATTTYQHLHQAYQQAQALRLKQLTPLFTQAAEDPQLAVITLPWHHHTTTIPIHFSTIPQALTPTALQHTFEGTTIRHFIDHHWQAHLQHMDELRENVRNAVYEQKDPLLLYKFEALKLFQQLHSVLNEAIITHLCRAVLLPEGIRIHRLPPPSGQATHATASSPDEPATPSTPAAAAPKRNHRVSVRYADGTVKKDVKFKTVAHDLQQNKCTLLS